MSLLQMAEEITEHVVEDLGDHVKLILVYGSMARGEATEFSDLDMVVITDGVSYHRSFILQGRPVEIWSMTLNECEKLITTPSISWGVAITLFFRNKVLYGDQSILDRLQQLYDSLDPQPFIQFCADRLVAFADILGKVRSAARDGDLIYARWASHCLANEAAGIIAMINKRYYLNQWGKHLPEIMECKILPKEFKHCYQTLWLGSDFDELISAIRHLYTEFESILQELGAKIPRVKSIREGMKSPKS